MSNIRNDGIEGFAELFRALANPSWLRIFLRLATCCEPGVRCGGEERLRACVGEVGRDLGIAPSTVSHQSRVEKKGIPRMSNGCSDKPQQADCCPTGGCCSPSPAATGKWKTVVFVLIVLAAVGVAAHSLLTRPSSAPPGGAAAEAQAALAALEGVSAALAEHDFLFVILPDVDDDAAAQAAGHVAAAVASIQAKGVRVGTLTLSREDIEFVDAAEAFAVDTFPAVVALKKGCGRAVVQGEITEASLLRAYAEACAPACGSGSGPCCP